MARYALLKAVNDYDAPDFLSLKCAESDARDLTGILEHKLGFEARYLEEKTAEQICKRISQIAERLKPGDTFLFYFAGHGKEHDGDYLFLLPGVSSATLGAGLLTLGVLTFKTLRVLTQGIQWKGVHRIFVFDSCRAPLYRSRDGETARFKGEALLRLGPAFDKKSNAETPYTVLTSCSEGESAIELTDAQGNGNGSFTLAFKEEINSGNPYLDENSMSRMAASMTNHLRANGRSDHQQTPCISGVLPVLLNEVTVTHKPDQNPQPAPQIAQLLEDFERQLAARQFDSPPYDCLKDTMEALKLERHNVRLMRELHGRVEAAKLAKKEEAQHKLEEENRKAEALREQEAREEAEAEAERKQKAAEEVRLAKLAEEEIARRKQAEAEEQARIALAAQRAEEARLAKEKQLQEAEARRKLEEVEATARQEAIAKAEQEVKEAAERIAREEAKRSQEFDVRDWHHAKALDTEASYAFYLGNQPEGNFREDAEKCYSQKQSERIKAETPPPPTEDVPEQKPDVPKQKSGVPGWAWGLGVVVLGGLALSLGRGGEKPAPAPPVAAEVVLTPAPAAPVVEAAPRVSSFADPFAGEMVAIPLTGRPFSMGDNGSSYSDEKPAHPVTIRRAYELGRTEVTQGQWKAVMGNNPSNFKTCGDNCPVERVSWDDVQQFIKKLNEKTGKQYRLPTEAEWEYACRGGGTETYCGSNDIEAVAWHESNSGNATHKVAQKQKNAFGLYDMSGNVWEWVQDCYHDSYNGAPDDGSEWKGSCSSGDAVRVLRGGSWFVRPDDARSANRSRIDTSNRVGYNGFRLARMLP